MRQAGRLGVQLRRQVAAGAQLRSQVVAGAQLRSLSQFGSDKSQALSITLTGVDQPGIVSSFCSRMEQLDATMLDVDDLVVHNHVTLQCIVTIPQDRQARLMQDLLMLERDLKVDCSFDVVDMDEVASLRRFRGYKAYTITMLSNTVGFKTLGAVTNIVHEQNFNIVRIERLSPLKTFADADDIAVVEMLVETDASVPNSEQLRQALVPIQKERGVDIAVQREGLKRHQKRMVVMDMDSTLIQQEVIDEIARIHGVYDEVAEVTHRAMNGELDFDESLIERCSKLKGAPESVFEDVYDVIQLTPGAEDFVRVLKSVGYKVAVLSGGFTQVVDKVAADLGLHYAFANTLEVVDGKLTGKVVGGIVNRERKRDLLLTMCQSENISAEQTISVGDGANDLDMLRAAGLGIAFNAKPAVQDQAFFTLNRNRLDVVLYLLGIRPKDVPEWLASSFAESRSEDAWKKSRKPH
eukprot:g703.t1